MNKAQKQLQKIALNKHREGQAAGYKHALQKRLGINKPILIKRNKDWIAGFNSVVNEKEKI